MKSFLFGSNSSCKYCLNQSLAGPEKDHMRVNKGNNRVLNKTGEFYWAIRNNATNDPNIMIVRECDGGWLTYELQFYQDWELAFPPKTCSVHTVDKVGVSLKKDLPSPCSSLIRFYNYANSWTSNCYWATDNDAVVFAYLRSEPITNDVAVHLFRGVPIEDGNSSAPLSQGRKILW
jgi:hypothetical protein